jgi:hypothetical protein
MKICCNQKRGALPTTRNDWTPDADVSNLDPLFCLQTFELNNTWRAYWFLQLHSTNRLHTTHIRAESKSKTSIYCLPTLSNSQISAEKHFSFHLHINYKPRAQALLESFSKSQIFQSPPHSFSPPPRLLQQNDYTRATRRSGKNIWYPANLAPLQLAHTLTFLCHCLQL